MLLLGCCASGSASALPPASTLNFFSTSGPLRFDDCLLIPTRRRPPVVGRSTGGFDLFGDTCFTAIAKLFGSGSGDLGCESLFWA